MTNNVISEVIQAVLAIHDVNTPNERRIYFTEAIETLKDGDPLNSTGLAFQLVLHTERVVRHVGWNIIEHIIRYKWLEIDVNLRIKLRNSVLEHVSMGNYSLGTSDSQIKTAISRSVVYMMENEWPQNWPELFGQFQNVVGNLDLFPQCQMIFIILRRLIEDVITLPSVNDPLRRNQLSTAITAKMKEILKMTIARIRFCLASGNNAKSGIELLSEIVEWVVNKILEDEVDAIVDVLCLYLQTDLFGIYEEAAKCLWKIASRKCIKTQETPIVLSMFRDTPMKTILTSVSIAAEVSSSSFEHYKYLKALCDLLCGLGVHLSNVWSYALKPPPNFNLYLSAISAFFLHPSLYIRAETANLLGTFSSHEHISKNLDFVRCITALLQHIPNCMEKTGYFLSSNDNLTLQYSRMDYEDDDELFRDFVVMRDKCCKVIRENTVDHFEILLAIVNDWITTRLIEQPENVHSDEWDMMKRFITTFITAVYQLDAATPDRRQTFVGLFDAILTRIVAMSNPTTINETLSILSAFFPILEDFPDRAPILLERFKCLLIVENENIEVLGLKRHCIILLLKMVASFSVVFKPYAQLVLNLVVEVADHVSVMQRANLVHVLGALSNLAETPEEQQLFLQKATQNNIQYFHSDAFSGCITSPLNFFTYIGLTVQAPASEFEAQTSAYYENRLNLKSHLTAILGVLQQVNIPEDKSNPLFTLLLPILPRFFQFASCINSLYTPENAAHIHSSYGRKVLDITPSERQIVYFSMLETETKEASSSPNSNDDSIKFLAKYLIEISDLVQDLLGYVGSRLFKDFYGLDNVSKMLMGTLYSVEQVPDYRIRFWIRRTWVKLICCCPADKYAAVETVTITLTGHLQQLIAEKWAQIGTRNEDAEPSEQELFLESLICVLSREYSTFLKMLIVDETASRATQKKDAIELISNLGKALLNNNRILENVLASLIHLINCPDTQTAVKSIPVANIVLGNFYSKFNEEMANFTLVHSIKAFQLHGSDELISNPLLGLIFTIYSCLRPIFPSLMGVLNQVPDSSTENVMNFDNRVMLMVEKQEKIVDKNKRDLMRKILKPIIALKVGEQYKRTVHFRRLI